MTQIRCHGACGSSLHQFLPISIDFCNMQVKMCSDKTGKGREIVCVQISSKSLFNTNPTLLPSPYPMGLVNNPGACPSLSPSDGTTGSTPPCPAPYMDASDPNPGPHFAHQARSHRAHFPALDLPPCLSRNTNCSSTLTWGDQALLD